MKARIRIFSLVIVASMVLTTVDMSVFAAEVTEGISEETTEESALEEKIHESYEEAPEEETDEELSVEFEDKDIVETLRESSREEKELEQIVSFDELNTIDTEYKLALDSLKKKFPSKVIAHTNKNNEIKIHIYEWTPIDDYDKLLGTYRFEPVLDTDYKIEYDIKLPILTVNVEDESIGPTSKIKFDSVNKAPSAQKNIDKGVLKSANNPSYYNAFESGYLPEVRNQGSEGACWAFATMAALEADLIKNNDVSKADIDLSELQLAYYTAHGYDDPKDCHDHDSYEFNSQNGKTYLSNGGNYEMASEALLCGVGPVEERYVPYSRGGEYDVPEQYAMGKNYAQVRDVYSINPSDRELIKQAIIEHGAVCAYYWATPGNYSLGKVCYSATYNSYYGERAEANHAVVLVGWDDNFSKDNFNDECKPEGDGAWLVRNSWGLNDYGMKGYFWLSYYDAGLNNENVMAYSVSKNMYDNVYTYASGYLSTDMLFDEGEIGGSVSCAVKYNVFAGETVEAVAVQTMNTNGSISVSVTDGTTTSSGSVNNIVAGTYNIKLDKPIEITEDKQVKVSYTIQAGDGEHVKLPVDLSMSVGGLKQTVVQNKRTYKVGTTRFSSEPEVRLYTNGNKKAQENSTGELKVEQDSFFDKPGTIHQIVMSADSVIQDASKVNWESTEPSIASVDTNGLITIGNKSGVAAVIGKFTDTDGNKYEVEINAKVKPFSIKYVIGDDVFHSPFVQYYYPGDSNKNVLPDYYSLAKKGYCSGGWYLDEEFTKRVNDKDLANLTGDLTLYHKWTEEMYSLEIYVPNETFTGYKYTISPCSFRISYAPMELDSSYYNYDPNSYTEGTDKIFSYWSTDPEGKNPISEITEDNAIFMPEAHSDGTYRFNNYFYIYPQYVTKEGSSEQIDVQPIDNQESENNEYPVEHPSDNNENKDEELIEGMRYYIGDMNTYYQSDATTEHEEIYTGNNITFNEKISVYHGTTKLVENRDYTLKFSNNKVVASALAGKKAPTVTIIGKGNYKDKAVFTFSIKQADLTDAYVTSERNVAVKVGKNVKLSATKPVNSYNGKKLTLNTDYFLEYYLKENGIDVKVADPNKEFVDVAGKIYYIKAVATGKVGSNFCGEVKSIVEVRGVDSKTTVSASSLKVVDEKGKAIKLDYNPQSAYDLTTLFDNSNGKTPIAFVKDGKNVLVYGTDFTVESLDNEYKSAGKHSYRIIGLNRQLGEDEIAAKVKSYVGSKTFSLEIVGTSFSKVKIAGLLSSTEYVGREIALEDLFNKNDKVAKAEGWNGVTLYVVESGEKKKLIEGTDYSYTMHNTGVVGKFTLVFTGINGYSGSIKKTITVKAYNLKTDNNGKIEIQVGSAQYVKTGAMPAVAVKYNNVVLQEGVDYTISYKNNKKIVEDYSQIAAGSRPTVIVKGKGNYSGSNVSGFFNISKGSISKVEIAHKDVTYNAKGKAGYFMLAKTNLLKDNGATISIGKNRDIEAVKNTDFIYRYAANTVLADGTEKKIDDIVEKTDKVLPGAYIKVCLKVNCSDKSPYMSLVNGTEIFGYYHILDNGKDISNSSYKVELKNSAKFSYNNGKLIVPLQEEDIVVYYRNKNNVLSASDYEIVSVRNNRFIGKATIVLKGKGQYGGTRNYTIKINAKSLRK